MPTNPAEDPAGSPSTARAHPSRDILILRDPRESARKCSLTPLRGLAGIEFVEYRADRRLDAAGRVLLHPDGDPIGPDDRGRGLLLVDCAWRRVDSLLRTVDGPVHRRSLPPLRTAYPRVSKIYTDPVRGLASVEALYGAVALLAGPDPELLAAYRWRARFLELNPELPT